MVNIDVTCPETNRHERIGCLVDSDGEILVVVRCTRFAAPYDLQCGRSCRELTTGGAACSCHVPGLASYLPSPNG